MCRVGGIALLICVQRRGWGIGIGHRDALHTVLTSYPIYFVLVLFAR